MKPVQSKNRMKHWEPTNKWQQSKLRFIALILYYVTYVTS